MKKNIRKKFIYKNISELHHQIEDLQNNNVSLEEEMSLKDEDIHQLRLEQEELLEEIERKFENFHYNYIIKVHEIKLHDHGHDIQSFENSKRFN